MRVVIYRSEQFVQSLQDYLFASVILDPFGVLRFASNVTPNTLTKKNVQHTLVLTEDEMLEIFSVDREYYERNCQPNEYYRGLSALDINMISQRDQLIIMTLVDNFMRIAKQRTFTIRSNTSKRCITVHPIQFSILDFVLSVRRLPDSYEVFKSPIGEQILCLN